VQITAALRPRVSVEAGLRPSIVLGVLIVVGGYLRLANLDALGFRWDEDLSSLAVLAILEHGIPLLPSGMIYPRGGVFLYMMVYSAELFGYSEFALRLPAALFGIAMIPLGYVFGRSLFDFRVGLIVAALITVSFWDIEFSRYARMYSPFGFFYVLTVYCLWKYRVQSVSAGGSAVCVALAVFAISLHQLGYTLVLAFYFPLILRGPQQWLKPANWVYPVAASGIVAAFFFVLNDAISRWMRRPVTLSGQPDPAVAPEAAGSMLDKLPLLDALIDAAPWLLIGLAAALLLGTAVWSLRSSRPVLQRAMVWLIAVSCLLQLFNIALLAWLGLAFSKREGLAAFRRADVIAAAGFIAVAFIGWLILAVLLGLGVADSGQATGGFKASVRSLLNYPHFFSFWAYAREWPMASVVALIGGLWAFHKASSPSSPSGIEGSPTATTGSTAEASGFVLLALATPLVVNGLFDTAFEFFRYSVPFNTFYFTLIGLALVHWREVLAGLGGSRRRGPLSSGAAGTVLLSMLVLAFDLNPLRAWLVTRQEHLNESAVYRAFDMESNRDFKAPAEFVASNATVEDLIIVLDSREYYNYIGRLDYWVRTSVYESQTYRGDDGRLRDRYVGTPLIMSVDELSEVLAAPQRRKWLIASDEMLRNTRAVTDDIKAFIFEQHERIVYVGRDGTTKVYRFD
jgi:4-amino-4-deoxy-L-arabinose transferase-like glycosyltransferase